MKPSIFLLVLKDIIFLESSFPPAYLKIATAALCFLDMLDIFFNNAYTVHTAMKCLMC